MTLDNIKIAVRVATLTWELKKSVGEQRHAEEKKMSRGDNNKSRLCNELHGEDSKVTAGGRRLTNVWDTVRNILISSLASPSAFLDR
jgi:hypothetical protein